MLDTKNTPATESSDESLLRMEMISQIASAYLSNNQVAVSEISGLIQNISQSVHGLGQAAPAQPEAPQEPKVSIKKSITPDYLISLESGRHLKSLKRYLRTKYQLSPDEYRAKWGLPKDYPMVAPNYAKARSELAKSMGLGTAGPGRPPKAKAEVTATAPVAKKGKRAPKVVEQTATEETKTTASA